MSWQSSRIIGQRKINCYPLRPLLTVMCVTHLCDTTASEAKEDVDMKETVQGIVYFQNAQYEKHCHKCLKWKNLFYH